jgi:hypothetical protein
VFAHIAGVPVEETALSLAPVAATVATAAGVKLRNRVRRVPRRPSFELERQAAAGRPTRVDGR